jgi:phosphoglucosamine mutase
VNGVVQPLEALAVKEAIRAAEAALGTAGRLLIRKSGTEPLIRVMAEGEDEALVTAIVDQICAAIHQVSPPLDKSQAAE